MTESATLVEYHGSLAALHGRYLGGPECSCLDCARMWATFLADPDGDTTLWDPRWLLCDPHTGAVVLGHVRPGSFTRAETR